MPLYAPGTTPVETPTPGYRPAVTSIVAPSGELWPLDGSRGVHRQPGRKGFHAPTYAHYRDESPAVDGAFWRGVRATVRELFIPIVILAQTREELIATRRALASSLSPKRGECTIISAQPDNTRRYINARYDSGLEGEDGRGPWGVLKQKYAITFVADDPYWFGDERPLEWGSGVVNRTELPMPGTDGFFEVVSASRILGDSEVDNAGGVDAYPQWTFRGPFTSIELTNVTSGKTLTLAHTADAGEWISIDTRPGRTEIVDQDGDNRWDGLTAGYSLWPLLPGINELSIQVAGSTEGTSARMVYRPRYESD